MPRGPDPSFVETESERFPSLPIASPDQHGSMLRHARRSLGLDIARAARMLAIPATKLVEIELGKARFVNEGDYQRAAHNLRASAARAEKAAS